MASKLRQGRDTEIPGVNAATALQEAIEGVFSLTNDRFKRPDNSFTAEEYAQSNGISITTAKQIHLYPLVRKGLVESMRGSKPGGGFVNYYRKKTQEIESIRKEAQPASKGKRG